MFKIYSGMDVEEAFKNAEIVKTLEEISDKIDVLRREDPEGEKIGIGEWVGSSSHQIFHYDIIGYCILPLKELRGIKSSCDKPFSRYWDIKLSTFYTAPEIGLLEKKLSRLNITS